MMGFKLWRRSVYLGCSLWVVAGWAAGPEMGHQWLSIDLSKPIAYAGKITWSNMTSGAEGLCVTDQAENVAIIIETTPIAVGDPQKPVRTVSLQATISPHDNSVSTTTASQPTALGKMSVCYSSDQKRWSSWKELRFTGHGTSFNSSSRKGGAIPERTECYETLLRAAPTAEGLAAIVSVKLRYEASVPIATCVKHLTLSLDSADIPVNPKAYPRVIPLTNDLHIAVQSGDVEKVTSMLAAHPEQIELKDGNGWTPLIRAGLRGDVAMVTMLLAKGADIQAADEPNKQTVLHIAASNNRIEVVRVLLAKGAKVNQKDGSGQTPIYLTADRGHGDVVKLLLANHADPNIASREGTTALHHAIYRGNKAVVETLITSGANVQASLDVARWAVTHEHEHMKEMLERFRPNIQSLVTTNRPIDKEQFMAALRASQSITPLALAEYYGEKEIAEILRKHGAK